MLPDEINWFLIGLAVGIGLTIILALLNGGHL